MSVSLMLTVGCRCSRGLPARLFFTALMLSMLSACAQLGITKTEWEQQGGPEKEQQEQSQLPELPDNPYMFNRPDVSDEVKLWFAEALLELEQGNLDVAEQHLKDIHEQHPGLSGPVLNLGVIAARRGQLEQAMALFNQSLAINPNNLEAYNQIGVLYRQQGEFHKAEEYYRAALAIWPGYAPAQLNLGILYELYLGQLEQALEEYRGYLRLKAGQDRRVEGWIADLSRRLQE